jgi:hypothetical protein
MEAMRAQVCSAADKVFPPGVLKTHTKFIFISIYLTQRQIKPSGILASKENIFNTKGETTVLWGRPQNFIS